MKDSAVIALGPATSDRARVRILTALAVGAAVALSFAQFEAASRLELTFDEAYYALWSQSLSFGYFDHPPMVAFLIRLSTTFFGNSDFSVRALSVFLVNLLPALLAWIAWRLFQSVEVAATAALIWLAMPLVVVGGTFVTPDAPLVLFWTLGLAAIVELWRSGDGRWLLAFGLTLGLALQSKFTAAFLAAGVVLVFAMTPSLRRWLRSPLFAGALGVAAAVFAPFVIWNAAHDWATFQKQGSRTIVGAFAPVYLVEFVAAQIGLIGPMAFVPLAASVSSLSWRSTPKPCSADEARRLMVAIFLPAFAYFVVHSLHDRVQGNWLAPLFPSCAILAADWIWRARQAGAFGAQGFIASVAPWAALLTFAITGLAYLQAMTGVFPLGSLDPTTRLQGYRQLAADVDARAAAEGSAYVLTQGYALTALLARYGSPDIAFVQPEERIRWTFRPSPPESLFASPGLAIGQSGRHFDWILKTRYRLVEPHGILERWRGGSSVEAYELFRVAAPFAPVLDPACRSKGVEVRGHCRP